MTRTNRNLLISILQLYDVESVVKELSSICSVQEFIARSESDAKIWRDAELKFDRLADSLPLALRSLRVMRENR